MPLFFKLALYGMIAFGCVHLVNQKKPKPTHEQECMCDVEMDECECK